jgi:hypothetical protein
MRNRVSRATQIFVTFIESDPFFGEFCIDLARARSLRTKGGRKPRSLKSLRWKNFRRTGLGQRI